VIQTIDSGAVREIPLKFQYFQHHRWTPDGTSIVANAADLLGRRAIVRVSVPSGDVTELMRGDRDVQNCCAFPQLSEDGRKLYYRHALPLERQTRFLERDLATGREREILRTPPGPAMLVPTLSPDGRLVATIHAEEVLVAEVATGAVRTVVPRVEGVTFSNFLTWTPDGRVVVVRTGPSSEWWLVPTDGRTVTKLTNLPFTSGAIHPDGRRVAHVAGERKTEVWMIENLWPAGPSSNPASAAARR
jgi:Tol biopolymer transport system component